MKNFVKKIKPSNILFIGLFIYLAVTRFPVLYENSKLEETKVRDQQVTFLTGETKLLTELPPKKILIFWATWCPPCRFEIFRFRSSFEDKSLPLDQIFFVNMGESDLEVKKFLKTNNYNFKVIMDRSGGLSQLFSVSGTPTVIHLEQLQIKKVSMGISPLGIISAKNFLLGSIF